MNDDDFIDLPYQELNEVQALAVLRTRNNSEVRAWMISGETIPEDKHWEFIRELSSRNDLVYRALFRGDVHIGSYNIGEINLAHGYCYMGVFKNPACGIERVGDTLVMHTLSLAGRLGLYKVLLEVFGRNKKAIALYERNGFSREGVLRHMIATNGGRDDLIVMSRFIGD
jgi:UDP-4-amino-4,6-dideoxy-N-acetyl-beta-L-altrosamine N-acetyltransferase